MNPFLIPEEMEEISFCFHSEQVNYSGVLIDLNELYVYKAASVI